MSTRPARKAVHTTPNARLELSRRDAASASSHTEPTQGKQKVGRPSNSADERAAAYERKKQRQRDARTGASEQRITTIVEAAAVEACADVR